MESLANNTGRTIPEGVEGWKIARYLIWAYSFKLGIYFIAIGAHLRTNITQQKLAVLAVAGFIYIAFAYMPLPGPSWLFGLLGITMMVLIVAIIVNLTSKRDLEFGNVASGVDLQLISYFFFAMATYTLCGLLGVRNSALESEKMIAYGLQADATSFAAHALIELALGWFFILLSFRKFTYTTAPYVAGIRTPE